MMKKLLPGTTVQYKKPLLVAYGVTRTNAIGRIGMLPNRPGLSEKIGKKVPVIFQESSLLWYIDPDDLQVIAEE